MKILKVNEFLNESKKKEKFKYEYGVVMLDLKVEDWKKQILSIIDEEDIYDEKGFGLEDKVHVTIFYGIKPDESTPKDVKEKIKEYLEKIDVNKEYELEKISIFENDDYDVVKFEIEDCDELHKLNKFIEKSFPYNNDYPEYKPHATIAYVKKGKGKKYIQKLEEPFIAIPTKLVYSYPIDGGEDKKTDTIIKYTNE
jgi:2'-5' RNA ligase